MNSQLRWALLLFGVLFIVLLALWEWRRPRQARGGGRNTPDGSREGAARAAEDSYALPPMHAREPRADEGLQVVGMSATRELPVLAPVRSVEAPGAGDEDDASVPGLGAIAEPDDAEPLEDPVTRAREIAPTVAPAAEPLDEPPEAPSAAMAGPEPEPEPEPEAEAEPASAGTPPIVDWPPEGERRIIALRVVPRPTERFAGRALRLALAAEGFVIGPFSIFHKPDERNRSVLSAASLTRPGSFDLKTMDSQHYAGISLFTVQPAANPAPQAFEDLVYAARTLNERLEGVLQDEAGGPLTAARITQLREQLRTGSKS